MAGRMLFAPLITAFLITAAFGYIPVVLMHGVAQGKEAMSIVEQWLQEAMPGVYVRNMEIGNGLFDSIFMHMDHQIQLYCDNVRNDSKLADGFNAIGFSQGTLITRGYIERCNNPPVFTYIGWCGPQDGQFGTPYVNIPWIDELLATSPYVEFVQHTIAPAQYWKDPYNLDKYMAKSTFLPDLNNEGRVKNETYRKNILSLKNFVLVYGTADTVIRPRQSAWFWFYANHSHSQIIPVQVPATTNLHRGFDWAADTG